MLKMPFNSNWKPSKMFNRNNYNSYEHTDSVHGHDVYILSRHNTADKSISFDFAINRQTDSEKGGVTKQAHKIAIIKHVKKHVSDFVNANKENISRMYVKASDRNPDLTQKKKELYKTMMPKDRKVTEYGNMGHFSVESVNEFYNPFSKWRGTWKKEKNDGYVDHHHYAKVGGHKVITTFAQNERGSNASYDVEFTVNGSLNSKNRSNKHATKIIKHVADVAKQFKEKHHPNAVLGFKAFDQDRDKESKKQRIYLNLAKKLSKKPPRVTSGRHSNFITVESKIVTFKNFLKGNI